MNRTINNRRRDDLDEYWFEKVPVTTKTAEEIREHTISEDLSPIERTLAMLNSAHEIQRLAGIRSISSVIVSDREETFRRILPKLKSMIEQTVDNEEHTVAAETIISMIQTQNLSYSEFFSLFAQLICAIIFPTTTNRFLIVDFGTIWCEALCNIIDVLPNTTNLTSLLDLIFNRTLHGSYVRDRLAIVLSKLASRLHSQTVENRLLPVFKNFINDTNADIRALACQNLSNLAQSFDSTKTINLILPLLIILSKDENLNVRKTCFESLLDLRIQLNESKSIEQVSEMIFSLIKSGLTSKTSNFISTIALRFADLCHTLIIFRIDQCEFIRELFLRLIEEKNIPNCRLACAKHFASIIDYLGQNELENEFERIFYQLCNDHDHEIRSIMINTILQLLKLSEKKHRKYLSIIWNRFLLLLNDTNQNVMLTLAKHLSNIIMAFSRDENDGFINGSICSTAAMPDSDVFLNHLLEYERRIFETTLSWRSCILCLQSFVCLPYILSTEQIQMKILPRVFSRIFSKQVCVREIAVDSYIQLLRKIPRRSIRKNAYQKLKTDLLFNNSYQWRVMYIRACRQILIHYSKRFFKENFLDTILPIENDPVLSVRIQLIPLLIEIKSILRLPADRYFITKIETIMGRFLSDPTYTLHDLANNGLLQLDRIRVYNPLSIYSNHKTNDDDDDMEKEAEEDLLDEIDPSSRRSSNKSNDGINLTKRSTDPLLNSKQTKLTKRSSNENQRKSSLIIETNSDLKEKKTSANREQRRQITTASATSSRSSKQTITKKTSKCEKISRG